VLSCALLLFESPVKSTRLPFFRDYPFRIPSPLSRLAHARLVVGPPHIGLFGGIWKELEDVCSALIFGGSFASRADGTVFGISTIPSPVIILASLPPCLSFRTTGHYVRLSGLSL
jgi:hypothetical protein